MSAPPQKKTEKNKIEAAPKLTILATCLVYFRNSFSNLK